MKKCLIFLLFIYNNVLQLLSSVERELVDLLVDFGPIVCGLQDKAIVIRLINRGLVYLDVPIKNDDYIYGLFLKILSKNNFFFYFSADS